jgi:ABC-type phosphate/phosphonate transport system substrate-binding protein
LILEASLPMYDLPALREATDAWWAAIARAFADAGIEGVSPTLCRAGSLEALWGSPRLFFTQSCGFPLTHAFAGRLIPLATPCYGAEGCKGPRYRSRVVVRRGDPRRRLADFRGAVVAVNGWESQSGWNALAALAAPLAPKGVPFFGRAVVTGSHVASMAEVGAGRADIAAIDPVTHALAAGTGEACVEGLATLCFTADAPGLPYATAAATPAPVAAAMRAALIALAENPATAALRAPLLIEGMAPLDAADYGEIPAMAAAAGPPPGQGSRTTLSP